MISVIRMGGGVVVLLLFVWLGTVAVSHAADHVSDEDTGGNDKALSDAGVEVDGGIVNVESPEASAQPDTSEEDRSSSTVQAQDEEKPPPEQATEPKKCWRLDKSVPRRPGSFIGGSSGVAMGYAWYTTEQGDLTLDFDLGPILASALAVRVGDAFFEWLTVGFQVNFISGAFGEADDPKTTGFALFLDTAFYPWRGLGIKPSVGLGFSYAQAGQEAFQISFGGPATLGFALSYEFRVTKLFTMGPSVQVTWTTGDEYDSLYLIFALEVLKWFKTAEG